MVKGKKPTQQDQRFRMDQCARSARRAAAKAGSEHRQITSYWSGIIIRQRGPTATLLRNRLTTAYVRF